MSCALATSRIPRQLLHRLPRVPGRLYALTDVVCGFPESPYSGSFPASEGPGGVKFRCRSTDHYRSRESGYHHMV
eukprot:8013472-Lingulodinium_polyedra.AAC.1